MDAIYVLHHAPDTAAMIVRLVLEGAGLPYRIAPVDMAGRQQDSPGYQAINPTGLIPALETPAGPISETAAILLWLGDRHALIPAADHPDRLPLLRWLIFIANTPHADLQAMFHPDRHVPADAVAGHHARMADRMLGHFSLLDGVVAENPALFTPSGVLAPYLCVLMRWSVLYPRGQRPWFDLARHPHLHAMARQMETTDQLARVASPEGLGPAPLTAPVFPQTHPVLPDATRPAKDPAP